MNKVALIILDGWGLAPQSKANAITLSNTPNFNQLIKVNPNATLSTSGEDVGLPVGQMGNSEVGHLNIGAGRIVWQELANINKLVREDLLKENFQLKQLFEYAQTSNKPLHFIGLVSDGGVHSHHLHLIELCKIAHSYNLKNVFIHAFTDGRDTDPKSGINFLNEVNNACEKTTGKLASITGRYYAMDRDKRWERIKIAYDALVHGEGNLTNNWKQEMLNSYQADITDEFIKPIIITNIDGTTNTINDGDIVLCFNFRTDRCREITEVLTQNDMPLYSMYKKNLYFATITRYDEKYNNVHVFFEKDNLSETLGEIISKAGKTQLRIAETEKYPHVTFFFSGGRESMFDGESRIMINSPQVATYDLQPEMSADEITNAIIPIFESQSSDFICLNFANVDMVGHTGSIDAAIKAVEKVDECLGKIIEAGKDNYNFIIIADHGNADMMLNADGSPNTAHTTNPVPIIVVSDLKLNLQHGKLCDVAPTILKFLKIQQPISMTGKSLIDI